MEVTNQDFPTWSTDLWVSKACEGSLALQWCLSDRWETYDFKGSPSHICCVVTAKYFKSQKIRSAFLIPYLPCRMSLLTWRKNWYLDNKRTYNISHFIHSSSMYQYMSLRSQSQRTCFYLIKMKCFLNGWEMFVCKVWMLWLYNCHHFSWGKMLNHLKWHYV